MGSNSGSLLVSCVTATDRVAMYQISPKFGSLNTTITVFVSQSWRIRNLGEAWLSITGSGSLMSCSRIVWVELEGQRGTGAAGGGSGISLSSLDGLSSELLWVSSRHDWQHGRSGLWYKCSSNPGGCCVLFPYLALKSFSATSVTFWWFYANSNPTRLKRIRLPFLMWE